MTEPWSTPGAFRSGETPITTTRPGFVSVTAETGRSSPASTGVWRLDPITRVTSVPAARYCVALPARFTSTATRSVDVSTVPAARFLVAAQTGLVCELAPTTLAPITTAAITSTRPPITLISSHRRRRTRLGTGSPSDVPAFIALLVIVDRRPALYADGHRTRVWTTRTR